MPNRNISRVRACDVGGGVWWAVRGAWEAAAWRAVIVRGARVPAHDSRFCRRVAGPALHSHLSYQIR